MLFTPRPKGLGKENFLKLGDGEEVLGVFRGTPYTFKRHWNNAQKRSTECIGEGCSICNVDQENKPSFRFRINFITSVDGKYVAKIFEGGGEMYDQLVALDKKFDLASVPVEITRQGTGNQTRYQIIPMANQPVTKEMKTQLDRVQLLALTANEEAA